MPSAVPPLYSGREIDAFLGSLDLDRTVVVTEPRATEQLSALLNLAPGRAALTLSLEGLTPERIEACRGQLSRQLPRDDSALEWSVLAVGGDTVIDGAKLALRTGAALAPLAEDAPGAQARLVAAPSRPGCGSQGSRTAVLAPNTPNEQSLSHPLLIPDAVLLDPRWLAVASLGELAQGLARAVTQALRACLAAEVDPVAWSWGTWLARAGLDSLHELEDWAPRGAPGRRGAEALLLSTQAGALADALGIVSREPWLSLDPRDPQLGERLEVVSLALGYPDGPALAADLELLAERRELR